MEEFAEELRTIGAITQTARNLKPAVSKLEAEATGLARDHARTVLLSNLESAIMVSEEFNYAPLRQRLISYFSKPERIIVGDGGIIIKAGGAAQASREWIDAQMAANEARRAGKQVHGWASNPSPAQRQAFWRHFVYPTDLYGETIAERLELLGEEEAPFWYFLEYGTGIGAYPSLQGTFFILKTVQEVGGRILIDYFLDQIARRFEEEMGSAIGKGVETGTSINYIQWSAWYTWQGRQVRHLYDSRTGYKVVGAKMEVR